MTEPNTDLPRLAPGTYLLTKRVVVKEGGLSEFVDEPEGEYIKGFWPRTRTRVTAVVDEETPFKPDPPQVSMEELREKVASVVDDYTAGEDYGSGPTRYYLTVDTPDELTEHIAAVLFPGLDFLFRAVADWQALWDEKEEWEKAAKESWSRENKLTTERGEALSALAQHQALLSRAVLVWPQDAMVRIRECIADPSRMVVRSFISGETVAGWGARAVVQLLESWRASPGDELQANSKLEQNLGDDLPGTAIDEDEHAELVRLITEYEVKDPGDAEELAHEICQLFRPDGPGCWAEDEADETPVSLDQLSGAPCGKTGLNTPEVCDGTCSDCVNEHGDSTTASSWSGPDLGKDVDLFVDTVRYVLKGRYATRMGVQRNVRVSAAKADQMLSLMESWGLVGPKSSPASRQVLVRADMVEDVVAAIRAVSASPREGGDGRG